MHQDNRHMSDTIYLRVPSENVELKQEVDYFIQHGVNNDVKVVDSWVNEQLTQMGEIFPWYTMDYISEDLVPTSGIITQIDRYNRHIKDIEKKRNALWSIITERANMEEKVDEE